MLFLQVGNQSLSEATDATAGIGLTHKRDFDATAAFCVREALLSQDQRLPIARIITFLR